MPTLSFSTASKRSRPPWSTQPSARPGVFRYYRRWGARISLRGHWHWLGLYDSEWYAGRALDRAIAAKKAGLLATCWTAAEVRAVVFGRAA